MSLRLQKGIFYLKVYNKQPEQQKGPEFLKDICVELWKEESPP